MNVKKLKTGKITLNPTYHGWPTVAITESGELLAVCSGNREGHMCPYGRVFFYRSKDGGETWTGPEFLSQGPLDDRDAGICIAADGSILVNYFTSVATILEKWGKPHPWDVVARSISLETLRDEHGLWMRRSTDNGLTWSEKYRTAVNNPHGPVLLKSGRLFMPGKVHSYYPVDSAMMKPEMAASISDDNGKTWQIIGQIPPPPGHENANCHELHAAETENGDLIVQIRACRKGECITRTWQTESMDGGATWSEPHYICDGFPSFLQRTRNGNLLMTYGWRKEPFGVRAMFSADGGKTWSEELIIHDRGLNRDLGYPSTVEMPDGTFFTLWYEHNGMSAELNYCRWTVS